MRTVVRATPLLIAGLLIATTVARADLIMVTRAAKSSTIAEFFIHEDSVKAQLEIGIRDLMAFRNLLPEPIYERLDLDAEPEPRRHRRFFLEDLIVRADGGAPLEGRVRRLEARPRVERDVLTGEPTSEEEADPELVIFAELEYELPGRPERLSFAPPRDRETGGVDAEIGFVVYHLGLPVNNFRYLGAEEILDLDWEDPWYSRFRNRNLRRQYDAPMMTFLYVEAFEVRHEIVLRPIDLQRWVDLGLEGEKVIPVDRQEKLKRRVAQFLSEQDRVTIDGTPAEPTLDRIHFIRRTLRRTGVIDPPEDLDLASATLGVIFVYPTSELPQEVTMTWGLFNEKFPMVPAVATDEAGGLPYRLRPDDAVLRWRNFLTNPRSTSLVELKPPPRGRGWPFLVLGLLCSAALVGLATRYGRPAVRRQAPPASIFALAALLLVGVALSISFAGASSISAEDAEVVVGGLLKNVYRAFDYRDEGQIYDILERSASGELLATIYLETKRGLEVQNQGGARVKVKDVEMLQVEPQDLADRTGFAARCVWNVSGSVGHWGHTHQRTNQYEALLTIRPVDGAWKITALKLLQEERL